MKHLALVLVAALALTGCNKVFDDQSVVGPDLSGDGPFEGAAEVVMTEPFRIDGRDKTRHITIKPRAGEDAGTVINLTSNTEKPFNAGVTWHAFTPIVAETNADARTYWLMGFNLTRTPDRAVYMIVRYPRGLELKSGLTSDAFEYLSLDCGDLDVARHPPEHYAPVAEGKERKETPLDPAPEAGDCEFNSLNEARKLAPLALQRYDQVKHYEDAPTADWNQLKVEVR
ncbi:hypothetical protein ABI_17630 [Asticcacaulis biprosthecium C19]|uniref:Lipoprotein n=1 Tax=Asticcacaulis biprosthecium C19 TaxID=715226 RepID=F4QKM1_9CAUL|nr:hypothetical protein [Asticcacaulis biprosthecium]EGF93323.1 hypothetical protein ABI_17630 [Asticcacaulis biprosthecium C19]